MNDLDLLLAKTQRQLAFFLIIILVLLSFGVVLILVMPTLKPQQEIIGLIVQVVTGVLALAGSAVGFFFARHRPQSPIDNDSGTPKSSAVQPPAAQPSPAPQGVPPLVSPQQENQK